MHGHGVFSVGGKGSKAFTAGGKNAGGISGGGATPRRNHLLQHQLCSLQGLCSMGDTQSSKSFQGLTSLYTRGNEGLGVGGVFFKVTQAF